MFNEKGLVIGMVVLKGKIENTGFAIPANKIAQFLLKNIQRTQGTMGIQRSWLNATETQQLKGVYVSHSDKLLQTLATRSHSSLHITKVSW